ncbi:MAG: hypothetical protein ABL963_02555 [Longimicrobiales bacterium]
MNVSPIGGVPSSFEAWLDRRRARVRAQTEALDDGRFADLAELIGHDGDDRPPPPQNEFEREEYRRVLREHEQFAQRMAQMRRRILIELRDVERQRVTGPLGQPHRALGGSLDGYV